MTKPPETLAQFVGFLVRGFVKGLPVKLIIAGAVAFFAWIWHTYLLVVRNEGFRSNNDPFLDNSLALEGSVLANSLVWILFASLMTAFIMRVVRFGLGNTVRQIVGTPRWLMDAWGATSPLARAGLFFGEAIVALILGIWLSNYLTVWLLVLLLFGILIARQTSILFIVLRLGWSDGQRWLKRSPIVPFNPAWAGVGTLGAFTGFLMAALSLGLQTRFTQNDFLMNYAGCLCILPLLGGLVGYVVWSQARPGASKVALWVGLVTTYSLLSATTVFADDGGWLEAGGTLSGWIQSDGAGRAVASGIVPALGTLLGVCLGFLVGGASQGLAGTSLISEGLAEVPSGSSDVSVSQTAPNSRQGGETDIGQMAKEGGGDPAGQQAPVARQTPSEASQIAKADAPPVAEARSDDLARVEPSSTSQQAPDSRVMPFEQTAKAGELGSNDTLIQAKQSPLESGQEAPTARVEPTQTTKSDVDARPEAVVPKREAADLQQAKLDESAQSTKADTPPRGESRSAPRPEGEQVAKSDSARVVDARLGQDSAKLDEMPTAEQTAKTSSAPSERLSQTAKSQDPIERPLQTPKESQPETPPRSEPQTGKLPELDEQSAKLASEAPPAVSGVVPAVGAGVGAVVGASVAPVTGWYLEILEGAEQGQQFAIGERTTIGRDRRVDIKIDDPKISRQHLLIELVGDTHRVTDLKSTNGTFVDERYLTEPVLLRPGEIIRLGWTKIRLVKA